MPPTKKMGSLHITLEKALGMDPLEKVSDYDALVAYVNERIKRKSLIFIVGDFYGDIDLSLLNKHEVFAVMVRDRFEEKPQLLGEMELVDPNTMEHHEFMLSPALLNSYQKELEQHDAALISHFDQHRIRHTKIYTDESPFMKLSNLFRH